MDQESCEYSLVAERSCTSSSRHGRGGGGGSSRVLLKLTECCRSKVAFRSKYPFLSPCFQGSSLPSLLFLSPRLKRPFILLFSLVTHKVQSSFSLYLKPQVLFFLSLLLLFSKALFFSYFRLFPMLLIPHVLSFPISIYSLNPLPFPVSTHFPNLYLSLLLPFPKPFLISSQLFPHKSFPFPLSVSQALSFFSSFIPQAFRIPSNSFPLRAFLSLSPPFPKPFPFHSPLIPQTFLPFPSPIIPKPSPFPFPLTPFIFPLSFRSQACSFPLPVSQPSFPSPFIPQALSYPFFRLFPNFYYSPNPFRSLSPFFPFSVYSPNLSFPHFPSPLLFLFRLFPKLLLFPLPPFPFLIPSQFYSLQSFPSLSPFIPKPSPLPSPFIPQALSIPSHSIPLQSFPSPISAHSPSPFLSLLCLFPKPSPLPSPFIPQALSYPFPILFPFRALLPLSPPIPQALSNFFPFQSSPSPPYLLLFPKPFPLPFAGRNQLQGSDAPPFYVEESDSLFLSIANRIPSHLCALCLPPSRVSGAQGNGMETHMDVDIRS
ncbi:hypothetical protein C7M84_019626 [Penaeus vannamei]|uniref:Uncharacterized protein n=1 Tax=Penaeus vannamei TaxID=6689 RepID=A0A3R7QNW8_PENVA|nr:hypothetical protein C7M84_019626 [Penaeus vannamei]